jgi:hypothetical protein
MLVPAHIHTFSVDPNTQEPVVVLKSTVSSQTLIVPVHPSEAASIAIASMNAGGGKQPITVDIVNAVVSAFGARFERVVIGDPIRRLAVARLYIHSGVSVHVVECRPHDAIALSIRCTVPIFIDDAVLDGVGEQREPGDAAELRSRISGMNTLDFGHYFMG